MKSGFILVLLAIGMLICVTYAAPASSEIQEKDKQEMMKELLDVINQVAKPPQEEGYDDEDSVAAQRFLSSFLRKGKYFLRGHRKGIMKGLGRFVSGALSGYYDGGLGFKDTKALAKQQNGDENIAKEEFHDQEDDDLMAAIESLPEEAKEQLVSALLPFGLSLFSNMFHKG